MKEYLITSGFIGRPRKLILTENYLEWESAGLNGNAFTRLNKADIADFKHGMDWIVWYRFRVGSEVSITFKDKNDNELEIRFNSHFGLRKDISQKYSDIVEDIWKFYHTGIVDVFLDQFYSKGHVVIQGITLRSDGIELNGNDGIIPWEKVETKDYTTYFAIFHRDNSRIHARIGFNEYGTETLWSAVARIKDAGK